MISYSQSTQSCFKNIFNLFPLTEINNVLEIVTISDFVYHYSILINSINASLFPGITQMYSSTYEGLILLFIVLSVSAESMNNLLYYWPLFYWTFSCIRK